MKLSKKLIISFIFTITIAIFITSFMANTMINKRFDSYLIEEQNIKFEKIKDQISILLSEKDSDISYEDISYFAASEDIYIEIMDADNNVLYQSNNMHHGGMMGNMMKHHMKMKGNGKYVEKTYELMNEGRTIGSLIIGYIDNSYLTESALIFKDTLSAAFAISGIITIIVGFIVSIFLSKGLTSPLVNITNTANDMRLGKLNSRSQIQTNTSELKELSKSIDYLGETLEKQESLRKKYASDIAHELRTPLTTLKSYLEAVIDGVWEVNDQYLLILMEEVNRLNKLVDDLRFTFEHSETQAIINKTKFNLSQEIENIVSTFKPIYNSKNYSLKLSTEKDIDVLMDKDKLKQILYNLLSNSIRFLRDNGKVTVSLSKEGNLAKIIVEDNGIGIKEEDLPHLFERFYRADISRNKETGGTGLGLSIVKNLVELHGGNISVDSEYGKGTKFTIMLPLHQ